MADIYVHFERGRDDADGPTFGPFRGFVQLTYSALRDSIGDEIAYHDRDSDEWTLWDREANSGLSEPWSDVIICDRPDAGATTYRTVHEWAVTAECQQREAEREWEHDDD